MKIQKEIKVDSIQISELGLYHNVYLKYHMPPMKPLHASTRCVEYKIKSTKCVQVLAESQDFGRGYHTIDITVAPHPRYSGNYITILRAKVSVRKMTKTILNSYINVAMTRMVLK